jgi:hypothetical protein
VNAWTVDSDWLAQELADRRERVSILLLDLLPDGGGWRRYADPRELADLEDEAKTASPTEMLNALEALERMLRVATARRLTTDYPPPSAAGSPWLRRVARRVLPELRDVLKGDSHGR